MSSERLPGVPMTPIRHYQHRDTGRQVLLIAAAHLRDQSYYDGIQTALTDFEQAGGAIQCEGVAMATPAEIAKLSRVDRLLLAVSRYSDRTSDQWVGSGLVLDAAGIRYHESWQRRDTTEVDLTQRIGMLATLGEGLRTLLADQVIGRLSPDLKRQLNIYAMGGVIDRAENRGAQKLSRGEAVTINYRNEVALAAFDDQIAREPERDIALFWGYGHFAGIADGLEARGYEPVAEDEWMALFDQ